jgi:hypothetical protein
VVANRALGPFWRVRPDPEIFGFLAQKVRTRQNTPKVGFLVLFHHKTSVQKFEKVVFFQSRSAYFQKKSQKSRKTRFCGAQASPQFPFSENS